MPKKPAKQPAKATFIPLGLDIDINRDSDPPPALYAYRVFVAKGDDDVFDFRGARKSPNSIVAGDIHVRCHPTLWIVQHGRKTAAFNNRNAAEALARKLKGARVRAFVEVQA